MTTERRLGRIAATFNAKARKYHVPGVVTASMLASLGTRCTYCRIDIDLDHGTWDHVIPFDRGGDNWLTNITRCCTTCQRTKHTKTPAEFATHRQMLVKCARPDCEVWFKPRWAERQRGMARFHSHQCAGMARGKDW